MSLSVVTWNSALQQFPITDAIVHGWSSHYGEAGGGFGYLRFSVPRELGLTYPDIQYGMSVTVYKYYGLVVYHGQIRQIEERRSSRGSEIMITALGWPIVFDDDEAHQHFCDTRLAMWKPALGEIARGDYRCDSYSHTTNSAGLVISCNNGASYAEGHHMIMRYEFNGDLGSDLVSEYARKITLSLSAILGNGCAFDGDIIYALFEAAIDTVNDSTDTVVYKDDSNEDTVINGDTLKNVTRDETATISTVTQATNTIVLSGSPDLSTWATGDSLEIVEGRIEYGNSNNHAFLQTGMTISNLTQNKDAVIESVDKVNYLITATSRAAMSGWAVADEIFMPGPIFWGNVVSVTGADLVYDGDVGEDNISTSWPLVNATRKIIAEVQSINTSTNTITVTSAADIASWEEEDLISQPVMLFYAKCDGAPSGANVTYKGEIGERLVKNDNGWVLYNETQDEYADVAGWTIASSIVSVSDGGDVSGWVNDDILRIYSPFLFRIVQNMIPNAIIWPVSDWREGAIMQLDTAIDIDTTGTPYIFDVIVQNFVAGTANESTFFQLEDLQVFGFQTAVNMTSIMEWAVSVMSGYPGHGMSDEIWDIYQHMTADIAPAVFEYMTPKEIMEWVCAFGDDSTPPVRVAWGIRLNDERRFYFEVQDLDTVDYYIVRNSNTEIQIGGDVSSSVQKVQGVYNDRLGEEQYTDWYEDTDAAFDKLFRRRRVRLDSVDNQADAEVAIQLYLDENKHPTKKASYRVGNGSVFTPGWISVPFDEIRATGRIAKIQDGRLMGEPLGTDARDNWTSEQVIGVEVDYQSRTASIIPAGAKNDFERYMGILAKLAEQ